MGHGEFFKVWYFRGFFNGIFIGWTHENTLSFGHENLAPVVQMLDSAIHRLNHYPADKY